METFTIVYTLLGGLGVFIFGMKLMSDGLQAMTGDFIRQVIQAITPNRAVAVGVGLTVTALVQSSSITTVMTVGLVNAGLMSLTQAISVIFGANIGTTVTGWILTLNGNNYGLLLVGIGFMPGLFAKSNQWQYTGKAIMGVGLLFLGFQTMQLAFGPLGQNPEFLNSITYFTADTPRAHLASILMGCLLTMVVQSSTAMLGITMALAATGVVGYHTAVTMVLGENVGKTITALLATMGANVNAKRAARAHALFNVIGVVILLSFLSPFISLIEWLVPGDGKTTAIISHIAMAHTGFNLITTALLLPFVSTLASFVSKITPDTNPERETPHLLLLGNPQDMLPATSLVQAEHEIRKMADVVGRMYRSTREYWEEGEEDPMKLAKILDYERITDNIHKEVTVFLCYVMEHSLSHQQSSQTQSLIKIADELESVADYLERLAAYRDRFKGGDTLEGDSRKEFFDFLEEVYTFYNLTVAGLGRPGIHDMETITTKSEELQIWADSIRDKHLDRISKGVYKPVTALTFSDMVVAVRKIRTHAFRMAESVQALNTQTE